MHCKSSQRTILPMPMIKNQRTVLPMPMTETLSIPFVLGDNAMWCTLN